jgi:hypothetical protein
MMIDDGMIAERTTTHAEKRSAGLLMRNAARSEDARKKSGSVTLEKRRRKKRRKEGERKSEGVRRDESQINSVKPAVTMTGETNVVVQRLGRRSAAERRGEVTRGRRAVVPLPDVRRIPTVDARMSLQALIVAMTAAVVVWVKPSVEVTGEERTDANLPLHAPLADKGVCNISINCLTSMQGGG